MSIYSSLMHLSLIDLLNEKILKIVFHDDAGLLLITRQHSDLLILICNFLPKTCKTGKPRSWPSLPEQRADSEKRRASWQKCHSKDLHTHGRNPQYSQKFPAVPRRLWRHRSMPDVRGAQRGTLLSFSLSDGLRQSPSSELPLSLSLSLACSLYLLQSCSLTLSLVPSLTSVFHSVPAEVW